MLLETAESGVRVDELAEEVEQALGTHLQALYRYGLRHRDVDGDDEGGRLLLVVERVDLRVLRAAGPASVHARKNGLRTRIDTLGELLRAADTHPVLTLTLMDTRQLICGTDVLTALHVEAADLRLRVEQALRGLRHDLTDEFLFAPRNELRLERTLRRAGQRLVYLLAGLLMVKGHLELPQEVGALGGAPGILRAAEHLLNDTDRRTLKALSEFSRREVTLAGDGLLQLFGAALDLLSTLIEYADTHAIETV